MVGDFACRVAVLVCGAMQKPVVGLPAGPHPNLLGVRLIRFAGLARRFAVLGFVFTGPLQAQGAPLDPLNHGGPFLGSLHSKHVAHA